LGAPIAVGCIGGRVETKVIFKGLQTQLDRRKLRLLRSVSGLTSDHGCGRKE
jgi:hypothetical protein